MRSQYNFIFLDCPPALDLLTLNALVAADRLLVPMQAEYFALEGISELLTTLGRIQAAFNPTLDIEGVILTMYDERTNLAQQVTENLRKFFGAKLLKTTIPRNIRLAEAPATASRSRCTIRAPAVQRAIGTGRGDSGSQ